MPRIEKRDDFTRLRGRLLFPRKNLREPAEGSLAKKRGETRTIQQIAVLLIARAVDLSEHRVSSFRENCFSPRNCRTANPMHRKNKNWAGFSVTTCQSTTEMSEADVPDKIEKTRNSAGRCTILIEVSNSDGILITRILVKHLSRASERVNRTLSRPSGRRKRNTTRFRFGAERTMRSDGRKFTLSPVASSVSRIRNCTVRAIIAVL